MVLVELGSSNKHLRGFMVPFTGFGEIIFRRFLLFTLTPGSRSKSNYGTVFLYLLVREGGEEGRKRPGWGTPFPTQA